MTTIGKILVIVNFIFSLVTGALVIMIFALSTNWERSYGKLKGYYEVSQANLKTYAEEANAEKAKRNDELQRHDKDIEKRKVDLTDLNDKLKKLKDDLAAEEKKVKLTVVSTENATQELLRLKAELTLEQAKVKDRETKIVDLAKTAKDQQDKAVLANQQARSYKDRAESLAASLERASQANERLKTGGSAPRGQADRRPPPEDVEGIVKNSDTRSGLVTLSVGSDAGLSKGNTMFAYRLSPKPQYLGEIRILEVNPHEAVGRPVLAQRGGQLQAGDIVASQIMGQR